MKAPGIVCGLTLGLALVATPAFAQRDAEGCKDHPTLPRITGYVIDLCDVQDNVAYEFPLTGGNKRKVEGKYWRISYSAASSAPRRGAPQILRNYTEPLVKKGGGKLRETTEPDGGAATVRVPSGDRHMWVEINVKNNGDTYTLTIVDENGK